MQKKIQLPKSQAIEPVDDDDVEGHRARQSPDELMRRLPSSGGELSPAFPSTGGDLSDDDVEGHRAR